MTNTETGPQLIAHRGYALRHPENTCAGISAAIAAGARHVEVDVQLSADGIPFLFHDRVLDRVCGVSGRLEELTGDEIGTLRAHEPWRFGKEFEEEPVARLSDLVTLCAAAPQVHAFVEIKRAAVEAFGVARVLAAIEETLVPIRNRATLISFSLEALSAARETGSLPVGPVLETWEQRSSEEVIALRPEVTFCNVDKLPESGALEVSSGKLAIYEIDDAKVARALHARGAQLIETFAIAEMLAALDGPDDAAGSTA